MYVLRYSTRLSRGRLIFRAPFKLTHFKASTTTTTRVLLRARIRYKRTVHHLHEKWRTHGNFSTEINDIRSSIWRWKMCFEKEDGWVEHKALLWDHQTVISFKLKPSKAKRLRLVGRLMMSTKTTNNEFKCHFTIDSLPFIVASSCSIRNEGREGSTHRRDQSFHNLMCFYAP